MVDPLSIAGTFYRITLDGETGKIDRESARRQYTCAGQQVVGGENPKLLSLF
jgi:hypothetical protein